MRRHTSIAMALAAAAFAVAGCAPAAAPPPYTGPQPSESAQHDLRAVIGNSLLMKTGPLAGTPWMVEGFSIVRNEVSPAGIGPVLRLRRGGRIEILPLENDADVADICLRVNGTGESDGTKTSAAYRRKLGL